MDPLAVLDVPGRSCLRRACLDHESPLAVTAPSLLKFISNVTSNINLNC